MEAVWSLIIFYGGVVHSFQEDAFNSPGRHICGHVNVFLIQAWLHPLSLPLFHIFYPQFLGYVCFQFQIDPWRNGKKSFSPISVCLCVLLLEQSVHDALRFDREIGNLFLSSYLLRWGLGIYRRLSVSPLSPMQNSDYSLIFWLSASIVCLILVPVGRGLSDGLTYPVNPRFDAEGRWRRRADWPEELR